MSSPPKYRLAIVMVGLPVRGKSLLAANLARFLNWTCVRTRVFSVAAYRDAIHYGSAKGPKSRILPAYYFDFYNRDAVKQRSQIGDMALNDLLEYLNAGDDEERVAILDASNVQPSKRAHIFSRLKSKMNFTFDCFFIEVVRNLSCEDEETAIENYIRDLHILNGSLTDSNLASTIQEYLKRIAHYQAVYKTIDPSEGLNFIRYENEGTSIDAHNVTGLIPSRILFYLLLGHSSFSSQRQCVYLVNNLEACRCLPTDVNIESWWTAPEIPFYDASVFSSLSQPTHEETKLDLRRRLEDVMMELEGGNPDEKPRSIGILAHPQILAVIYQYYCPERDIPTSKTSIIEIEARAYGINQRVLICGESAFCLTEFIPFETL